MGTIENTVVEKYCPRDVLQKMEAEFYTHKMVGTGNEEYTNRFHELLQLVPHMAATEERRVERYTYGLIPEIRAIVAATRPPQEASTLVGILTTELIRNGKYKDDNKRKADRASGSRKSRRQRGAKNFTIAATPGAKPYAGPFPKCARCNYHHPIGNCTKCTNCQRMGHTAQNCRAGVVAQVGGQNRACYECGSTNHFRNMCPRVNRTIDARPVNQQRPVNPQPPRIQAGPARGRAFALGAEEARQDPNVVVGTFLVNGHYAYVLFDSGAERSFVSLDFKPLLGLEPGQLNDLYAVEYANGHEYETREVYNKCSLVLADREFEINLIPIQISSFDIIVGMDWLSTVRADISCF